jgi:hypothetical protein
MCRRDKAIFKDRDCGGLDYCKLFPIATSDAAVSPSTCSELRDAKRESCTFSQDEKALPLLQRLTNAVNPADPAGQQLTLSFWMRALPSANTPLMPKLRIFGSLGSAHPAGQQTLLDVSYNVQSGAVRVQVCAHVPARVCFAAAWCLETYFAPYAGVLQLCARLGGSTRRGQHVRVLFSGRAAARPLGECAPCCSHFPTA